jgi:hypothetical protein
MHVCLWTAYLANSQGVDEDARHGEARGEEARPRAGGRQVAEPNPACVTWGIQPFSTPPRLCVSNQKCANEIVAYVVRVAIVK